MKAYNEIVNMILERIDAMEKEGRQFYWVKPWTGGAKFPTSFLTGKTYKGINIVTLSAGEYLTFNQIQKNGGRIKKGAVARPLYFYSVGKKKKKKKEGDEEEVRYYFLRRYTVFHIDDIDGIDGHFPAEVHIHKEDYPEVDKVIRLFARKTNLIIDITKNAGECFYSTNRHLLRIPEKEAFTSVYSYYSALFHEIVHSTMKALNRKQDDSKYCAEELVAQIGSQLLLNWFGIIPSEGDLDNDINYVRGWAAYLKDHKSAIVSASSKAGKAVDYFLKTTGNNSNEE